MNLYQALQGILDKVKLNNENVLYSRDEAEMLRTVLDNQVRLAESMMILGGLMQSILSQEMELQIIPPKDALKN